MRYAVLTTRVAPVQQGFYFVNSGFSGDGRYLWFYCAFPPNPQHMTGVIDFLTDDIRVFPDTAGSGWMVEPETGNLYWGTSKGLFMRTPRAEDRAEQVGFIPEEIRLMRVSSAGTHLTFTADRKEILADVQTAQGSVIGTFSLADGHFTKWYQTKPGVCYNHAQMRPGSNDMCLCAHEGTSDIKTQKWVAPPLTEDGVYPRLEIICRDGSRRMLIPQGNYATHEWWSEDGQWVYYCNNGTGDMGVIARNKPDGSPFELICDLPLPGAGEVGAWHAHCSSDEKYFVLDGSFPSMGEDWWRGTASTVRFYNKETDKTAVLLSYNPVVTEWGWTPRNQCPYHIDPHPRFVLNDRFITFTTTVRGHVDFAIAPVDQLIDATR